MLVSKIETREGLPALIINGRREAPVMFFGNNRPGYEEILRMHIRMAADHDVHIHSLPCQVPFEEPSGRRDFSAIGQLMDWAIENDPQAMVLLRVGFTATGERALQWERDHPGEMIRFIAGEDNVIAGHEFAAEEGTSVTMASDAWAEASLDALEELHAFFKTNPRYDDHLLGYHVACGETGEWFHFGLRERGVDICPANRAKWQAFLTEKYGSMDRLEAAWRIAPGCYGGFADIPVPTDIPGNDRTQPAERTLLLEPGDQRFIDYGDYSSELVAARILQFARAARRITAGEKLLVFFYGYYFEVYDARTGHFRLNEVLDCPDIDAFTSPVSYGDRNQGGIGALMSPADTIMGHGKLWIVENDIRSTVIVRRLGPKYDWIPMVDTVEHYCQVMVREMGQMLTRGLGCWYMDLLSEGWQYHPLIWKEIQSLQDVYRRVQDRLLPLAPDVAFVVDERAMSLVAHAEYIGMNALYRLRERMYRSGVKFGLYTLEDVLAGRVPSAKLILLTDPFDLSAETADQLLAIQRAQGAEVVYMHGFGRTDPGVVKRLTGMDLRTYDADMQPLDMNADLSLLPREAAFTTESPRHAARPATWVVQEAGIQPLACYTGGALAGKLGAARHVSPEGTATFIGAQLVTHQALTALFSRAGIPVYSDSGDAFIAGEGVYVLHTTETPGERTVRLPRSEPLWLYGTQERTDTDTLTVPGEPATTYLWINRALLGE